MTSLWTPKAVVYGHMISQCFHREMKIAITKTFIQGDCKILVDEIVDVTKINKKGVESVRSNVKLIHQPNVAERKGPLTIWPVYAYTLAAQKTIINLPMLILYTEDNSSMSYEELHVQIFTYSVIIW